MHYCTSLVTLAAPLADEICNVTVGRHAVPFRLLPAAAMSRFIKQAGLPSMLKDGSSVQEDPLLKNIQACKELAQMTRSSFGPFGLNKMVINHIGKLFAMEEEVGDGSNLCAEQLRKMGLKASEIVAGYAHAAGPRRKSEEVLLTKKVGSVAGGARHGPGARCAQPR
eukprot:gene28626-4168_t